MLHICVKIGELRVATIIILGQRIRRAFRGTIVVVKIGEVRVVEIIIVRRRKNVSSFSEGADGLLRLFNLVSLLIDTLKKVSRFQ